MGAESCWIALHVPGIDPVVRANWEQIVTPFLAYVLGGWVGGLPLDGLARRQLNRLCLIDSERVPRSGREGGGLSLPRLVEVYSKRDD